MRTFAFVKTKAMYKNITYPDIKQQPEVVNYVKQADRVLEAIGYTEHGLAHVTRVAVVAGQLLEDLGYPSRECEMARIAGFMHDIGNVVNRADHAQTGAIMAFRILDKLGMDPEDVALVISAIGHHDDGTAFPVNAVAAAVILADKSDVRRTRVRKVSEVAHDIHDRVNYAVTENGTQLFAQEKKFRLSLTIDTAISPTIEYFEIFLHRMTLCRSAAQALGLHFELVINGAVLS